MITRRRTLAVGLVSLVLAAGARPAAAADEIALLATVTRAVNIPMIVGLRLLEREDGIKITMKDLKSSEAVILAVTDGQGEFATGFAPFYPAVEKGAGIRGLMELSRPEFIVMAKKEIADVKALNGVRLASHSPKSTVQSLMDFYFSSQAGVKPEVVFMPEGSPARAQALLRGAVDAAAFDLSAGEVVNERAPGKFHTLIDFTNQPVSSSTLVVNAEFAKKRPEVVRKVVRRMIESYRKGIADPKFWVRERGDALKGLDDAKLEAQLRALAKVFDPNGGIERMDGAGAKQNMAFQVAAGNLSGPADKWKPGQFFDLGPLHATLKELGKQ